MLPARMVEWLEIRVLVFKRSTAYAFANKQTLYSILSGACLSISSLSSAPLMCLKSCLIALGPAWLSILCHFVAIAPTSL